MLVLLYVWPVMAAGQVVPVACPVLEWSLDPVVLDCVAPEVLCDLGPSRPVAVAASVELFDWFVDPDGEGATGGIRIRSPGGEPVLEGFFDGMCSEVPHFVLGQLNAALQTAATPQPRPLGVVGVGVGGSSWGPVGRIAFGARHPSRVVLGGLEVSSTPRVSVGTVDFAHVQVAAWMATRALPRRVAGPRVGGGLGGQQLIGGDLIGWTGWLDGSAEFLLAGATIAFGARALARPVVLTDSTQDVRVRQGRLVFAVEVWGDLFSARSRSRSTSHGGAAP